MGRLTPLDDVVAAIEAKVAAAEPRRCPPSAAVGATLADDVVVTERPVVPIALRDGYAVEAAAVADAGPYTPMPFAGVPPRIDAGMPLPPDADAVAPLDAVTVTGDHAVAIAAIAPGEGVLPAGGDATARVPLRRAGERLRALDAAVLTAAGVTEIAVRSPRFRIACDGEPPSAPIAACLVLLRQMIGKAGGIVVGDAGPLAAALADARVDAVIAIGGTGSGRNDGSVRCLAQAGRVECHGMAISPGETAAFGAVGARPVLLIPGRIDATLAVWLLLGRRLIARLAAGSVDQPSTAMPLRHKIASTIGVTELVPVRCIESGDVGVAVEGLGSNYLSFSALTRSDGYIVVPADREGFVAGARVAVRPWP